jgi:hypothetical protein
VTIRFITVDIDLKKPLLDGVLNGGPPTGFEPDEARCQIGQEGEQLVPRQPLVQAPLPVLVDSVHLKHTFGQINPQGCNLHRVPSLCPDDDCVQYPALSTAVAPEGRVHSITTV